MQQLLCCQKVLVVDPMSSTFTVCSMAVPAAGVGSGCADATPLVNAASKPCTAATQPSTSTAVIDTTSTPVHMLPVLPKFGACKAEELHHTGVSE